MITEKGQKGAQKYICNLCHFICNKKYNWLRHIKTKKHNDYERSELLHFCGCGKSYNYRQNLYRHKIQCNDCETRDDMTIISKMANSLPKMANISKESINYMDDKSIYKSNNKTYNCCCGKIYKHRSSLSKHRTKCNKYILSMEKNNGEMSTIDLEKRIETIINDKIPNNTLINDMKYEITKTVIQVIQKNNSDIMNEVKELANKPTTINNNTQFNVLNYLNTECKDAMNLSDFIGNIIFSLKDLDFLRNNGIVKSMENTVIKQIEDLDKTKRPLHCSDRKRNIFYVKEKDNWKKDKNNAIIHKNIKKIPGIHSKTLLEWKRENNDWLDDDNKQDFMNQTIISSTDIYNEKIFNKVLNKLTTFSLK